MAAERRQVDIVAAAAAAVDRLLPVERAGAVRDAVMRMRCGQVRVLVLGEAKRGKSTLVNTLFGGDLLPTGVLPLTSVATAVVAGDELSASVRYRDGRSHEIALDQVAALVSETGNRANHRGVDRVRIVARSSHLPHGTEVVDTPGTGSVHLANTTEAEHARATVDIAVLVATADPPVSAAEVDLAAEVMATASAAAVVVNKSDLVRPGEVEQIVPFTRHALGGVLDDDALVVAMSARNAPDDAGWRTFMTWLGNQIEVHGEAGVVVSAARAVAREARSVLDSLRIQQELLRQPTEAAASALAQLEQLLATARRHAASAGDHVHGQARRLRQELDTSHQDHAAAALRDARQLVEARWKQRAATPERHAQAIREDVQKAVSEHVEVWFAQTATELDTSLRLAGGAVLAGLRSDLQQAREAAADVLRVELGEIGDVPDVAAVQPPSFELTANVGWRELFTSSIADHLPVRLRWRRVYRQLREWVDGTVPKPFGRARSSLQGWLEAATATVERELATTAQAYLSALEQALVSIRAHHDQAETDVARLLADLAADTQTVHEALADLEAVIGHAPATSRG